MEQPATYKAIRRRERAEEAPRFLLLQGERKFGSPDAATRSALEGIRYLALLEELGVRLVSAASWQELLPAPPARRRNGRRKSRQ